MALTVQARSEGSASVVTAAVNPAASLHGSQSSLSSLPLWDPGLLSNLCVSVPPK